MKIVVCGVLAAMFCSVAPVYAAPCAPKSLVHIVVTDIDPTIPPTAFGAQPKSYYRLGSGKARTEEALDAENGIHELLVVNSPNVWMANLYDNTGRHIVDQNPPTITQMPVFSDFMASPKLSALEFGCEADYIAANDLAPVRSEQVGADTFDVYRVEDGTDAVEILERPSTGVPSYAREYRGGKLVLELRYDAYAVGGPDDPALFAQPPNVKFTEDSPAK